MNCQKKIKTLCTDPKKMEKYFSQPFVVAEVFTNMPGKFVSLKDTIKSFKSIMDGEFDSVGETSFYMVGGPDEILAKQKRLAEEAEKLRLRQLEQEKRAAERAKAKGRCLN